MKVKKKKKRERKEKQAYFSISFFNLCVRRIKGKGETSLECQRFYVKGRRDGGVLKETL